MSKHKNYNKKTILSTITPIQKELLSMAKKFEEVRLQRERVKYYTYTSLPQHILLHKTISEIRALIHNKRGCRTNDKFICTICNKVTIGGWKYKNSNNLIYLCHSCKEQAKPKQIANKRILYNNFEQGK